MQVTDIKTDQALATGDSPTFANLYVPDGGFTGISAADGWTYDSTNGDISTTSNVDIGTRLNVDGAIVTSGAIGSHQTSVGVFERSGDRVSLRAYGATAGSGYLTFRTGGGNDVQDNEAIRIDSNGNTGFGTSTFDGTAAGVLAIANGTEPAAGTANQSYLYAKDVSASSELFAMDEAGNATQLSPHPADFLAGLPIEGRELPWAYSSQNDVLGKKINVDMMGAIRAIEGLSGEQFIYLEDTERVDWDDEQVEAKERAIKQAIEDIGEIEVSKGQALEKVPVYEEVETDEDEITYELVNDKVKENKRKKKEKRDTGKKEWKLKDGVRLDGKTGKFYRMATEDDIEKLPKYKAKEMPKWMKDRMRKN